VMGPWAIAGTATDINRNTLATIANVLFIPASSFLFGVMVL
jgi:hypothetical protein